MIVTQTLLGARRDQPLGGDRAVDVQRAAAVGTVAVDRERRGQHQRVPAGVDPDVRDERVVEQVVQLLPVGAALLGQPAQGGASVGESGSVVTVTRRSSGGGVAAARSRSILRPRKYAVPQSTAKIAPSTNISGITKPSPMAAAWSTQPSA